MIVRSQFRADGTTTLPPEVCRILGVGPGNVVAFETGSGGSVRLRRVAPMEEALAATLSKGETLEDAAD